MPSRFERVYKWLRNTPIDDKQLNTRFEDVDNRFNALEQLKIGWEEALLTVQDAVLRQTEQVIAGLRNKLLSITRLEWLTARSSTALALVEGAAQSLLVQEADRDLFTPGSWSVLSRTGSADDFAVVRTRGYDRGTGQWDFDVEVLSGAAGSHDDWEIGALAGSTLAQYQMLVEARDIEAKILQTRAAINSAAEAVEADRQAVDTAAGEVEADRQAVETTAVQVEQNRQLSQRARQDAQNFAGSINPELIAGAIAQVQANLDQFKNDHLFYGEI